MPRESRVDFLVEDCYPRSVEIRVEDNGMGIPERAIADSKSLGLIGMRERVNTWGGNRWRFPEAGIKGPR